MKKNIYIVLAVLLFSACTETFDIFSSDYDVDDLMQASVTTRSSVYTTWSDCDYCSKNGQLFATPWRSVSESNLPSEIRHDVRESDGWRILFSTVILLGYEHPCDTTITANYLILYNINTGVLKGFYYNTQSGQNNTAFWQLEVTQTHGPCKLFNFVSDIAVPGGTSAYNLIAVKNINNSFITSGFEIGWNCFMQELSYDPNSINETLTISGMVYNKTHYNLYGTTTAEFKGTITTLCPTIDFGNVIGTAFGASAKAYVKTFDSIGGVFGAGLESFADNATNLLVTTGINKIFGSLLTSSSTTTQDIQLTSHGKISLSGESTNPATGIIMPISGIPLNALGQKLGVWNLASQPSYTISSCPELVKVQNGFIPVYTYLISPTITMTPVVNPDIDANVAFN